MKRREIIPPFAFRVCLVLLLLISLGFFYVGALPSLAPLDYLLAAQVSTATKYAQRSSETKVSITLITAEEIRRFDYQTLKDGFNRDVYASALLGTESGFDLAAIERIEISALWQGQQCLPL